MRTGGAFAGSPRSGSRNGSVFWLRTCVVTATRAGNLRGRSPPTHTTCSRRSTRPESGRRSGSAIRSAAGSSSSWQSSHRIESSGPHSSTPQSSFFRTSASTSPSASGPIALSTPPTLREHLEEEMREHLVQHSDGSWRFRYCQSAVVSMYGELTTPPPPPETLRVPTLLVHAGEFGLVREDQIDAYRVALGNLIEVIEVPGGHMVYWDAYEQTADAVDSFLQDSRS